MPINKQDAIWLRGLGVALDVPDDKAMRELHLDLALMRCDRDEWKEAFRQMRASREKWKRRWTITFGVLLAWIVAAGLVAIALEEHLK